MLWPPDVRRWLPEKDSDAGKDWGQEKGATEDETIWWAQSTWIRANSRRQWRTGKPGMQQFTGSQRVKQLSNWITTRWKYSEGPVFEKFIYVWLTPLHYFLMSGQSCKVCVLKSCVLELTPLWNCSLYLCFQTSLNDRDNRQLTSSIILTYRNLVSHLPIIVEEIQWNFPQYIHFPKHSL